MANLTIIRKERRTIPVGACPVDLMGELVEPGVIFYLTARAMMAMFVFPVEKSVTFIEILDDTGKNVMECDINWYNSEYMTLWTEDNGKTFTVKDADTKELWYTEPTSGDVIAYLIDLE